VYHATSLLHQQPRDTSEERRERERIDVRLRPSQLDLFDANEVSRVYFNGSSRREPKSIMTPVKALGDSQVCRYQNGERRKVGGGGRNEENHLYDLTSFFASMISSQDTSNALSSLEGSATHRVVPLSLRTKSQLNVTPS